MSFLLNWQDGVATYYMGRDTQNRPVIKQVQECQGIVDENKRQRNDVKRAGKFWKLGSVPNVILVSWMNEHGVNWFRMPRAERHAFLRRKLNDPDWRDLKSVEGKI